MFPTSYFPNNYFSPLFFPSDDGPEPTTTRRFFVTGRPLCRFNKTGVAQTTKSVSGRQTCRFNKTGTAGED